MILFIGKALFVFPMALAAVIHFVEIEKTLVVAKGKNIPAIVVKIAGYILIVGLVAGYMGTWPGLLATFFFLSSAIGIHNFWKSPKETRKVELELFMKDIALAGGSILLMFA